MRAYGIFGLFFAGIFANEMFGINFAWFFTPAVALLIVEMRPLFKLLSKIVGLLLAPKR
jgi:hypothetical protein